MKHNEPKPTPAELEVLQALWAKGPCTVREIFEEMTKTREVAYTTALKTLQVMHEKGLVKRKEHGKGHAYSAIYSEETTQRSLVDDFLDKAFGGAAQKLVLQALQSRKSTPAELKEIRDLLDKLEEK
jgi:BlaI family transcriptional regulator, penicillinase repressor